MILLKIMKNPDINQKWYDCINDPKYKKYFDASDEKFIKEPINIDFEELNEYIKDGIEFIATVSKIKTNSHFTM